MGPSWLWLPSLHSARRAFPTPSFPVMSGCWKVVGGGDQGRKGDSYWRKEMLWFGENGQDSEERQGMRMSGLCVGVKAVWLEHKAQSTAWLFLCWSKEEYFNGWFGCFSLFTTSVPLPEYLLRLPWLLSHKALLIFPKGTE